jgi:hypothetical protein
MDYQQASKIRSSGLSDLVAARLMSDESIGDALKQSIDQKLKANAKSVREKFDILNISKLLTGGSSIAPIIIGNILGRDKEDIKYFADAKGRLEKILDLVEENLQDTNTTSEQKEQNKKSRTNEGKAKKKTASRVKTDERVVGVVNQIYGLLKRELERKKLAGQILYNFNEEEKAEGDRRHKELLNVLAKLTVGGKTVEYSPSKEEDVQPGSILGSILESFGGAKAGMTLIKTVGRFFMSPAGLLLLGSAAVAYGIYRLAKSSNQSDEAKQEAAGIKQAEEVGGLPGVMDEMEKRKKLPEYERTMADLNDAEILFNGGDKLNNVQLEGYAKRSPEAARAVEDYKKKRDKIKSQPAPEVKKNNLTPQQIEEYGAIKQKLIEAVNSGDKTKVDEANEALVDWAKRSGEKSGTATSENVVENSEKLTELKNKRDAFGAAYVAMKKNPNTPTEALSSMEKNLMDVGEQIKKLEEPPEQAKVEQISAVNPLGEMATKATNENNELTRTGQGVEVAPPVVSMNNKAISIGGETMMAEVTIRTEEDTMDRLVSRMMRPV